MAGGARVLARRGLRRGAHSCSFSVAQLAEAEPGNNQHNVYIETDGSGQLTCGGGGGGGGGEAGWARAVRQARLASAPPHASALLCLEAASPARPGCPALRLVTRADVPPLHELHLWFDDHMLAYLDMPFLTLRNITGKKNYTCHHCSAEFEHPNPLKIHMFLSCQTFEPDTFWQKCVVKLQANTSSTSTLAQAAPVADPAQLEALAAAWGRSRDGHVCLYCGKLYSRKYGLKIHIRTHTGYKPLRCRHCLRAFGDPSNLNKHVRLHASSAGADGAGSVSVYACSLCRKPLARRRDLQRHMRSHHAPCT